MALRIGTSGWNYPTGQGHVERHLLPAARGPRARVSTSCASIRSASTPSRSTAPSTASRAPTSPLGWVKRTPADFEFAVKLYPEVHASRRWPIDPGPVTQADVDAFKGGIDPLAAAGKLGPLLSSFQPASSARRKRADYLAWLLKTFAGYPLAVELRHRSWSDAPDTAALLDAASRRLGADRRTEFSSSIRQDLTASASRSVLPAPARPQRRAVVGPRRIGRPLQLLLFSATELEPIAQKVRDVARDGEEGLPVPEQPLLRAVGRRMR